MKFASDEMEDPQPQPFPEMVGWSSGHLTIFVQMLGLYMIVGPAFLFFGMFMRDSLEDRNTVKLSDNNE